jgi:hypothetical protein
MQAVLASARPPKFGLLAFVAPWIVIPTVIAIVTAVVNHFFVALWLPALDLAWTVSAIISALWCGYFVLRRAWWPGLFAFVLPLAMIHDPLGMARAPIFAGDVLRFVVLKSSYDSEVAQLPKDHVRFAEVNWGGLLFGSDGVVYDETDEIGMPKSRRSAAWQARARDTDLMCHTSDLVGPVTPLWGHYFLAEFGC